MKYLKIGQSLAQVIILGLLILLLLNCAREKPIEALKVDPVNGIPTGAKIIGFIDFTQGRKYQPSMQAIEQNPVLKEIVGQLKEKVNLDPTQDINAIAVGVYSLNTEQPPVLLLIKGNFDEAKISAALQEQQDYQVEQRKFRDYQYYQVKFDGKQCYFSIPDPQLAFATLFSGEDLIKRSMELIYKSRDLSIDDVAFAEIKPELDRTAQFWIIGQLPGELMTQKLGQPAQSPITQIKAFSFYIKYFEEMNIKTALLCANMETADQIKTTISTFLEQMKMFMGMAPEMAETIKFLDKVRLKVEKNKLLITLTLTEEELQAFQSQMEKLQQQFQPMEPPSVPQ